MESEHISMSMIVVGIFGFMAFASAFVITYGQQKKNYFITEKERIKISLEAALSAFLVLTVLSMIAMYVLIRSF